MEKKTKIDVMRPFIDEAFARGECYSFRPNGVSMLPFIKGGEDTVTIEKYSGGAKKFDIVFYQRENGKYVMHRIVKAFENRYLVTGDNQWWIEEVCDNNIFAIVTNVSGKKGVGGFMYLHTLFIRRFIIHLKDYANRHLKKMSRGDRK